MTFPKLLLYVGAPLALLSACAGGHMEAQAAPAAATPQAKVAQPFAGPVDPRAQKSYQDAMELTKRHDWFFALEGFKKADKLDGNKCGACAEQVLRLAQDHGDFKLADAAAEELITLAATPEQQAQAHLSRARLLLAQGKEKKKQECFAEAQREAEIALAAKPGDAVALLTKGLCLAEQEQDEQARAIFTELVAQLPPHSVDALRVSRYAERPDLVRARMAPAFSVRTMDGKRVSLDELQNKVVLIDF